MERVELVNKVDASQQRSSCFSILHGITRIANNNKIFQMLKFGNCTSNGANIVDFVELNIEKLQRYKKFDTAPLPRCCIDQIMGTGEGGEHIWLESTRQNQSAQAHFIKK